MDGSQSRPYLRFADKNVGGIGLESPRTKIYQARAPALRRPRSFQQARFAFVEGEQNSKCGAATDLAIKFDSPTMRPNNSLHNHQAKA